MGQAHRRPREIIPACLRTGGRSSGALTAAGVIPACAGSSIPCSPRTRSGWDHPHACGEQELPFAALVLLTGSSPRVRGAVPRPCVRTVPQGIIPARAGSSQPYSMSCRCLGDHPRVCGEQLMDEIKLKPCPGSSPRVRGAALDWSPGDGCRGIIPACAGSRTTCCP